MTSKGAYYNDNDPDTADWLDGLKAAGSIPAGDVDRRDVREVHPDDLKGYTQCRRDGHLALIARIYGSVDIASFHEV